MTPQELLTAYERGGFTVRQLAEEHGLSKSTAGDMLKRARAERERSKLQQAERRRTADRSRKRTSRAVAAEADSALALEAAARYGITDVETLAAIEKHPHVQRVLLAEREAELTQQCRDCLAGRLGRVTVSEMAAHVRAFRRSMACREARTHTDWLDERRIDNLGDDDRAVVEYQAKPRQYGPRSAGVTFDGPAATHIPALRNQTLLEVAVTL